MCCFLDVGADFVNKDVSAEWLRKYRTSHVLWVDHERDIIKEYAEGGGGYWLPTPSRNTRRRLDAVDPAAAVLGAAAEDVEGSYDSDL